MPTKFRILSVSSDFAVSNVLIDVRSVNNFFSIFLYNCCRSVWKLMMEEIYLRLFRILSGIHSFFSFISIAATVLIIFVILKYKRLRQEKWSMVFLIWVIVKSLTSIIICTFYIFDYLFNSLCFLNILFNIPLVTDRLLIIILTLHWYMKLHCPEKFIKFDQLVKYISLFVCVFVLVIFLIGAIVLFPVENDTCFHFIINFHNIIMLAFKFVFVSFMIFINVAHAVKKRSLRNYSNRKNVPFILSNTLFLSYLPSFLAHLILSFSGILTVSLFHVIYFVTLTIEAFNPFCLIAVLYHFDKNYNTYFKQLLRCRCRERDNEHVEQPVIYTNEVNNTC